MEELEEFIKLYEDTDAKQNEYKHLYNCSINAVTEIRYLRGRTAELEQRLREKEEIIEQYKQDFQRLKEGNEKLRSLVPNIKGGEYA